MKKNIFNSILTIFIFSLISVDANAVSTRGSPSCGEWVRNQDEKAIKGLTYKSLDNESWLIGFLSGYAMYSNVDFIKTTDNDSLFLWVTNYCRGNPLDSIGSAGDALFFELRKQKGL